VSPSCRRAAALALGASLSGCAAFRPVGRNVVGGALDELERRGGTASLSRDAVVGARDELTSDASREKLQALEAAMMEQMTVDAAKLRQELLGEAFRADVERARAEFLDKSRRDLGLMRDDLLGPRTQDAAGIVADRVVGEITREKLARLRDELLGERSRLLAQQLVQQTSSQMERELRQRLEGEKQALKDELNRTVWVSSVFAATLIVVAAALVVIARRRERIIEALSDSIQDMPDRETYDDLSRRIVQRARDLGVSALVRARLARRTPPEPPPAA